MALTMAHQPNIWQMWSSWEWIIFC